MFEIEYFALGYIPIESDEEYPNSPDKADIDGGEVEYYCQSLDIDVIYDVSDGEKRVLNQLIILNFARLQIC